MEVNIASEELIQALSHASTASYHTKSFRGGGTNHTLICHKDKIVIPSSLQNRVVEWYHTYLLHPGVNCTEATIRQHLWWPNMRDDIKRHIGTCILNIQHTANWKAIKDRKQQIIKKNNLLENRTRIPHT